VVRFYDIDSAQTRLEEVRTVVEGLRRDRDEIAGAQSELARYREGNGSHEHAAEARQTAERVREAVHRMEEAVAQLESWDVTLRDIPSGLIDFPAMASGRPIWLCWRLGEEGIGWWHETTEGFAGRKPLAELT
jgi:hypothetical protein